MALTLEQIMRDGLWPKVISACTFTNIGVPLSTTDKLNAVREQCALHNCEHIMTFIDIIQFDETSIKSPVSYIFCLVPYYVDMKDELSELEKGAALLQHDLLVGSRCGEVRAVDWLLDLFLSAESISSLEIQYINEIFGNALTAPRRCLSVAEVTSIAQGARHIREFPVETGQ